MEMIRNPILSFIRKRRQRAIDKKQAEITIARAHVATMMKPKPFTEKETGRLINLRRATEITNRDKQHEKSKLAISFEPLLEIIPFQIASTSMTRLVLMEALLLICLDLRIPWTKYAVSSDSGSLIVHWSSSVGTVAQLFCAAALYSVYLMNAFFTMLDLVYVGRKAGFITKYYLFGILRQTVLSLSATILAVGVFKTLIRRGFSLLSGMTSHSRAQEIEMLSSSWIDRFFDGSLGEGTSFIIEVLGTVQVLFVYSSFLILSLLCLFGLCSKSVRVGERLVHEDVPTPFGAIIKKLATVHILSYLSISIPEKTSVNTNIKTTYPPARRMATKRIV